MRLVECGHSGVPSHRRIGTEHVPACGSVDCVVCAKRKCHERRLVGAMHADDVGVHHL